MSYKKDRDDDETEKETSSSWDCVRCKEHNGWRAKVCHHCGVSRDRVVKKRPSRSRIGGKRGRNSGKVKSHGKG